MRRSDGFNGAVALTASILITGCSPKPPPAYALAGFAVVGEIIRVKPATLFVGDVAVEGNIFWMQSIGPEEAPIVFASMSNCPAETAGKDLYLVMLGHQRIGYEVEKTTEDERTGLTAMSCAKVDPDRSNFRNWQDR